MPVWLYEAALAWPYQTYRTEGHNVHTVDLRMTCGHLLAKAAEIGV